MKSPFSVILMALFLLGFVRQQIQAQTYVDVASLYNISFTNQPITPDGGGVSFADFNGDGLDDISLASGLGDSLEFYQNTGSGFVKLPAFVDHTQEAKHLIWVDFDNDGDKDLYVSSNISQNKLYRNDSLTFTDVSTSVGFSSSIAETYGACWGDINNDGWLDLYEANQINFGTGYNTLYISNGNATFTDITASANAGDSIRYAFAPAFLDYDKDGDLDIFIANDRLAPTTLLRNNGDSTFTNVSAAAGAKEIMDGMSATVGDFNNDSWLDIYVTNTTYGNKLFSNNGNGTFTEVADSFDVEHFSESWNAVFFDFDLDGDLDMHVCDVLIGSAGAQTFYENVDTSFIQTNHFSGDTLRNFCSAIGDINGDGFIDLVSANKFPSALQLWEHKAPNSNHYVKVLLEGVVSNRDAVGSWIEVYAGSDRYVRYTHCGEGFQSQNSFTEIIGLASHSIIDSLIIRWMSGHVDRFDSLVVDTLYQILEGSTMTTDIEINGSDVLCYGDSVGVNLSVKQSYSSYWWNTGDTTQSIMANTPGYYYAVGTNDFGISDTAQKVEIKLDSLYLTALAYPDTNTAGLGRAEVNVSGNYPPFYYQWDDPLSQTSAIAVGLNPGKYQVTVTDSLQCSDTISVVVGNYDNTHLSEYHGIVIKLWPSPADQQVKLSWASELFVKNALTRIEVFDLSGKKITSKFWYLPEQKLLDVSDWKNGVYILKLKSHGGELMLSTRMVIAHQ